MNHFLSNSYKINLRKKKMVPSNHFINNNSHTKRKILIKNHSHIRFLVLIVFSLDLEKYVESMYHLLNEDLLF